MRRNIVTSVVVGFVVSAAGCGSDSTAPNNSAPCTVTITGPAAIAGTYTCVVAPTTVYVPSTNFGTFELTITGSKTISGTVVFSGAPSTSATYGNANSSNLPSFAFLVTTGTATWEFTGGPALGGPLGSVALRYSSIVVLVSSAAGSAYTTHGTLDATLVPSPGSTGTGNATMHIAF